MGNNTSAASERQQPVPSGRTRDAAAGGQPSGRERDHSANSTDVQKVAAARYLAPQSTTPQSRIVVDIRSANLDKDYNVYIKQEPQRDVDIASVWSGLQALGGLFITVLTIQKLWEDIRFIRLLRRELSTLVGSLTDAGGAADANSGDGGGISRPARPRGASGPATAPSAPAARQLDLHLNELSDLLAGGRGAAAAQAADAPTGGNGASSTSASGDEQLQGPAGAATRKETTWASISGLMEVKILLQEATVLPTLRPDLFQGIRQPPKALLLFGPPGTGKTLLARAVAAESRATFLPVTGSSVLSMWYGQSEQNVKALFEKARKRQPAIIFIDEVDSLLGKRSSGGRHDSAPDKRVTNEFLAFIDGIQTQQAGGGSGGSDSEGGGGDARVVVIAATNTPWDLDEAALSRFSRRIYVPLPDRATRESLMRKALEGVSCDVSGADWQRLAERCDKYSGRDLVQVCREAAMRPLRELWGRRLLEVSPSGPGDCGGGAGPGQQHTTAAQQRLVDLVANSLAAAAGAPAPSAQPKCRGGLSAGGGGSGTSGSGRVEAAPAAAAAPRAARGCRVPGPGWAPWSRLRWAGFGFGGDRYTQSKKQARRELERWKQRHGASWCDVDAIMQQAERLVEIRRQGQGQGQQAHEEEGRSGAAGQESARGPAGAAGGRATATAAAQAAAAQTEEEPGCPAPPDGAVTSASPASDAADPEAVRVWLRVRVGEDGASAAAADGGAAPPLLQVTLEAHRAHGRARFEEGTGAGAAAAAAADPGACTSGPGRPEGSAAAAAAASRAGSGGGASPAHSATAAAAVAKPGSAKSAADAGASSTRGGGGGDEPMSLDKLLELPVSRVRPVTVADLEAALQVISCTEMDQSAKYTEWDEQYGSGATESGRSSGARGRAWMSMYA